MQQPSSIIVATTEAKRLEDQTLSASCPAWQEKMAGDFTVMEETKGGPYELLTIFIRVYVLRTWKSIKIVLFSYSISLNLNQNCLPCKFAQGIKS
jgi:hypothetical protein